MMVLYPIFPEMTRGKKGLDSGVRFCYNGMENHGKGADIP